MATQSPVKPQSSRHIQYFGARPTNDRNNHHRDKLCHLVRDAGCFHEIFPEKFYLVYLSANENTKDFCDLNKDLPRSPFIFWGHHEHPKLKYEPFNMDFGPFNLATTHQFFSRLKVWVDTYDHRGPDKCIVIVVDERSLETKLNMTLAVACAGMTLFGLTDQEVIQRLSFYMMYKNKPGESSKELNFKGTTKFSDVSGFFSRMKVTLNDCIKAFYTALQLKFYDYYEFDHSEYLFYETVGSGDLNWIVPGKILAFAGPSDKVPLSKYNKHPPSFYFDYFKDHNVTTIIRLNDAEYKSSEFEQKGFSHFDLIFPDGYPPTSTIAENFIKIIDEAKGAVAVHCYAGIGRTGTLIAAYLMSRYEFTAEMATAWTRICRPGCVIGQQQDWLVSRFQKHHIKPNVIRTPKRDPSSHGLSATLAETPIRENLKPGSNSKTTYAVAEKTFGQAKALLLAKKQRENVSRPCTRNSTMLKNAREDKDKNNEEQPTQNIRASKTDLILDLGKTVPLMIRLSDMKNLKWGENPKTYIIKDGNYYWSVKWPEPDYVKLKYVHITDTEIIEFSPPDASTSEDSLENLYLVPVLEFRFESLERDISEKSVGVYPTKMVPYVYF